MKISTLRHHIQLYKFHFEQSLYRQFFSYFGYGHDPLVLAIEALIPTLESDGVDELTVAQEARISALLRQKISAVAMNETLYNEGEWELTYPSLESDFEREIRKEISGFRDKSQFTVYCNGIDLLLNAQLATPLMIEALRTIIAAKKAYYSCMNEAVMAATTVLIQATRLEGIGAEDIPFIAHYIAKNSSATNIAECIRRLKLADIFNHNVKKLFHQEDVNIQHWTSILLDLNATGILERLFPAILRMLDRTCADYSMKFANISARIAAWTQLSDHHLLDDTTQWLVERAPDSHRYASTFRVTELTSGVISASRAGIPIKIIKSVLDFIAEAELSHPECLKIMIMLQKEKLPIYPCMNYLRMLHVCSEERKWRPVQEEIIPFFVYLAKYHLLTDEIIHCLKTAGVGRYSNSVNLELIIQLNPALINMTTMKLVMQYQYHEQADVIDTLNLLHKNKQDIPFFIDRLKLCKDNFSYVARRLKRLDEAGRVNQDNCMTAITHPAADMVITKLLSEPAPVAPISVFERVKRKRKGKNHADEAAVLSRNERK